MDSDRSDGVGDSVRNVISGDTVVAGPVVQAGRIESLTFAAAPPPAPLTPRQVPPPRPGFVNRTAEFAALGEALAAYGPDSPPATIVITGLGGVGKTELVSQWVWRELAERFPDGQLYVDLAEVRRDGGIDVGGVIGTLLRALGVHESLIPAGTADRSALFRSATAGRRLLVVLDNAQHAAEVRPVLPGHGLVVVLSRKRLASLEVDGAVPLTVAPLDADAGLQLVRRWQHAAAEPGTASGTDPGAAARLVAACGGLPLALRAAGEWLIERPHMSLEAVVDALADERIRPADTGRSVAAVFDAVTATFCAHTLALYRFLGAFPGTTFTADVAEAAGVTRFEDGLRDLRTAHMAVGAGAPGRFRLHDVVAAHARARTGPEEEVRQVREVRQRVTDFYLTAAARADRLVLGPRLRLQEAPPDTSAPEGSQQLFHTGAEALEWLDAERANLLAVLRMAADEGRHDAVWRLCESLWALYHSRKHYADWIESHRLGIEAARWEGRIDAEVRMRNQLARAHHALGEYDLADAELRRADELLDAVADARLPGMIRETQGLLCLARSRPEEAIALFTRALHANEGDAHGIVVQTYNLGQAVLAAGRPQEALDLLDGAMATARAEGDDAMRLRIGIVRGRAYRASGMFEHALAAATDAALLAERLGQVVKLKEALELAVELGDRIQNPQVQRAGRRMMRELRQRTGIGEPVD
ncbi:NB-ARC domain-containing protein [Streptomyces sp. NBC_01456]|uniref:NB-ARC domain-containing protein n=1 Tax=unclassified Streptomyces TaxID=2593676 RepID=UPI002E35EA54|nr:MULTISPECIES: NB-ARC domain-containing protein [unclassified Streptomyces]